MIRSILDSGRWMSHELGLRFLARRKASCAIVVLAVALALGANTVVFSVLKAFLLSSFGLPEPDRLFVIAPVRDLPGRGSVVFAEAYPNYRLIRERQRSFEDVACILQGVASWDERGEVRPLQAARVTASFFSTTVQPVLGRAFEPTDEGPTPAPLVVISHALWQGALAGDAHILGRSLLINGAPHTVIGVMPAGFTQPLPTNIWLPFDLPRTAWTAITGGRTLAVYGRIKDGVSREAAAAEMAVLTQRALEASADNRDYAYTLQTIQQVLLPRADRTLLFVQVGAFVLVLLAVLNLASLLIAWGFDRRQEMSVRLALGAQGSRIARMMVLQSVAVVMTGGVVGLLIARAALPAIRRLDVTPALGLYLANLRVDTGVLLWSAGAALVAGALAGILPSWFGRRIELADALRSSSRSTSLSPAALRWQKALVFAQALLSVVIVSAAALIAISFRNLLQVPDGFLPENRVVARVQLPDAEYAALDKRRVFAAQLMENLAREPALAAAGFSSTLPVSDVPWGGRFFLELPDGTAATEPLLLHIRRTSWNYLATMGIPLLQGRPFAAHDDVAHPAVAIVSRAAAERLWPNESAVGKRLFRIQAGQAPVPLEIVGVAGNVMDAGYNAPAGEAVYLPYAQVPVTRLSIVVQPRTTREAAVTAVRHALRASDPILAADAVAPLESLVRQANALPRLQTILLLTFAIVAVGIVALGSYGLMSQLVASREREFAMRVVFGAARGSLGSSVLLQVTRLTIPGILIGVAVVWLLSGLLRPFVFGVEPRSLLVTIVVSTGVLVLASAAALPPAWRAMQVDIRKGIISA